MCLRIWIANKHYVILGRGPWIETYHVPGTFRVWLLSAPSDWYFEVAMVAKHSQNLGGIVILRSP